MSCIVAFKVKLAGIGGTPVRARPRVGSTEGTERGRKRQLSLREPRNPGELAASPSGGVMWASLSRAGERASLRCGHFYSWAFPSVYFSRLLTLICLGGQRVGRSQHLKYLLKTSVDAEAETPGADPTSVTYQLPGLEHVFAPEPQSPF